MYLIRKDIQVSKMRCSDYLDILALNSRILKIFEIYSNLYELRGNYIHTYFVGSAVRVYVRISTYTDIISIELNAEGIKSIKDVLKMNGMYR